jgi:hypothetical protein
VHGQLALLHLGCDEAVQHGLVEQSCSPHGHDEEKKEDRD